MTDPTHSDDEIVSSYIDGEATLDEVVRVQADPELLAEVQEFEAVAELVSTPVAPLPQSDVDNLIGNALDQSATSDRITDLAAVRAIRTFNPQRLATIAATLIILAGAVGALIMFNSAGDDDMTASTADSAEAADDSFGDDGDDMAFDSDMPAAGDDMGDDGAMAEAMPESADMPDEYFEDDSDDMAAAEETADYADDSEQGTDDQAEATTTVAAVDTRRSYRLIKLEIAESYETLDELINQATEQWRELVDAGATPVPQTTEEEGLAEQALADAPCGPILHAHIDTLDHSLGSGGITVAETTVVGSRITAVMVELSIDTAVLLAAAEPDCTVDQLADLGP